MTPDAKRVEEMRLRCLTEAIETSTPASRLTMLFDALELDRSHALTHSRARPGSCGGEPS